jgi:hypothetical protein
LRRKRERSRLETINTVSFLTLTSLLEEEGGEVKVGDHENWLSF